MNPSQDLELLRFLVGTVVNMVNGHQLCKFLFSAKKDAQKIAFVLIVALQ
jgi:hypothetical protein